MPPPEAQAATLPAPGDRFRRHRNRGGHLHGTGIATRTAHHVRRESARRPPQLQYLEVGDTVRAGGAEFRVTATAHQRRTVQLELEAQDGEQATLIGVATASLPF